MKKGRIFLLSALLLVACVNPSNTSSSINSLTPVTISSLKEGMVALNSLNNYTLDLYNGDSVLSSRVYLKDSIGVVSKVDKNLTEILIEDDKGIYPLKYYRGFKAGEYYLDQNNNKIQDLWNSELVTTLYNVENEYINSISSDINELELTNKRYKLAFIKSVGYSAVDYASLENINVLYDNNELIFKVKFSTSPREIVYKYHSFNSSINEDVETYLSGGGTSFIPNRDLSEIRRLMLSSNYTRDIYDISSPLPVGKELFNPHYFYYETSGGSSGQGALEMNQKANENHPDMDLYGCYTYVLTGSLSKGFSDVSFFPNASYNKPIIEEMYHYPMYMKLWNNLQFIEEGMVEEGGYANMGTSYHISDINLIEDFAVNFSIDQSFPLNTCVPFGLGIEFTPQGSDANTIITFVYCFSYFGTTYAMKIPFTSFGVSNIEILDEVYLTYND